MNTYCCMLLGEFPRLLLDRDLYWYLLYLNTTHKQRNSEENQQWTVTIRTEQNRTEQSHDDVTRFLYVISLWMIFKPSPIWGSITDGNALLFRSEAAVVVFQLCTVVYIMMLLNSNYWASYLFIKQFKVSPPGGAPAATRCTNMDAIFEKVYSLSLIPDKHCRSGRLLSRTSVSDKSLL